MIDIDPVTLIVSAICMGAFIAPLAYQNFKVKSSESLLQKSFLEMAQQNGIQPEIQERWRNHYQLGLDPKSKKLIYHRYGAYPSQSIIDLSGISKVTLDEKNHMVQVKKEKRVIIDYLALQLHYKDPNHPTKSLEIYDGELFSDLAGERVLAGNWKTLLEKTIHS